MYKNRYSLLVLIVVFFISTFSLLINISFFPFFICFCIKKVKSNKVFFNILLLIQLFTVDFLFSGSFYFLINLCVIYFIYLNFWWVTFKIFGILSLIFFIPCQWIHGFIFANIIPFIAFYFFLCDHIYKKIEKLSWKTA